MTRSTTEEARHEHEWDTACLICGAVYRDYLDEQAGDPADQRQFVVDEKTYDDLTALLDRPAVYKPRLAELLAEDSRFRPAAPTDGAE